MIKKMAKKMSWVILLVIMLNLFVFETDTSMAASTATAYDVHITGNLVVGETLTCNYKYYDPSGQAEQTDNVAYQWYRIKANNAAYQTLESMKIANATDKIYILNTADDVGNAVYYCSVTTSNESGAGSPVFSALSGALAATAPEGLVAGGVYIVPDNPTGSSLPGDTLKVNFAHQGPAGSVLDYDACSYQWASSDNANNSGWADIQGATERNYTIQPKDYGKSLKVFITPATVSGLPTGTQYTALAKFMPGNLISDIRASVTLAAVSVVYERAYPLVMKMRGFGVSSSMFTYGGQSIDMTIDAGREVYFDSIYLHVGQSDRLKNAKLEYKLTSADTWNTLKDCGTDEPPFPAANNIIYNAEALGVSDTSIRARYFRLTYESKNTSDDNANTMLYTIFPFLSKEAQSQIFSIDSLAGAGLEGTTINITDMNITTKALTDSLVCAVDTTKTVFDREGTAVNIDEETLVPINGKVVVTSSNGKNTTEYKISSPEIDTSIQSIAGAVVDNDAGTISEIILGTSLSELFDSVVPNIAGAVKTLVNSDGSPVNADGGLNALLMPSNISDYKFKITALNQDYTGLYDLFLGDSIFSNDFEYLDNSTVYNSSGGADNRSALNASTIYWGDADTSEVQGVKRGNGTALQVTNTEENNHSNVFIYYNRIGEGGQGSPTTTVENDIISYSADICPSADISLNVNMRFPNAAGSFLTTTPIVFQATYGDETTAGKIQVLNEYIADYVPGTWYKIGYTYDVANGCISVWINGKQVVSNAENPINNASPVKTSAMCVISVGRNKNVDASVLIDNIVIQKSKSIDANMSALPETDSDRIRLYPNASNNRVEVLALEDNKIYGVKSDAFDNMTAGNVLVAALYEEQYNDDENNTFAGISLKKAVIKDGFVADDNGVMNLIETASNSITTHESGNIKTKHILKLFRLKDFDDIEPISIPNVLKKYFEGTVE